VSAAVPSEVPKRLRLDLPSQRLHVEWHDGHVSEYGAGWLRFVCPCAGCRGHAPGQVPPPEWEAVKDVRITDATGVGGYAIQFAFSDGHTTGIYAFDRLREVCPCRSCRGDRPPRGGAAAPG
jgi:DUF971 family protein